MLLVLSKDESTTQSLSCSESRMFDVRHESNMSDQGLRRPFVLALAGAAALTLLYVVHQQYQSRPDQSRSAQSPLHRSNAVRRSRRRWRRGFPPQQLDYDPTIRAIIELRRRNVEDTAYGEYHNTFVFSQWAGTDSRAETDLRLIPSNLGRIYQTIQATIPSLNEDELAYLRFHIHGMFVQNFLREEYITGYIIGEDSKVLASALESLGVIEQIVPVIIESFDRGVFPISEAWDPSDVPVDVRNDVTDNDPAPDVGRRMPDTDGTSERATMDNMIQALAGHEAEDRDNTFDTDAAGSQNMLDLLYNIAGEQARRDGYIHRGVECNSCGACPIQGVRYHCANCFDYDLCENCEASQVHALNHVFYKIRIPAPTRGHIKQVTPMWYPGKPQKFPTTLPKTVSKPLLQLTGMDRTEMEASYEQYKCLAGHEWPADPSTLGMAIDRRGFDMYFTATSSDRPSPPNLIYDRIFAFYDTNNDGLIGFNEYICGLADLQDKSRRARLRRIFRGYDLDGDGFVDRKDFLRMFRSYYTLSKELNREMISSQEDYMVPEEELRRVIEGSQPISGIFEGSTFIGHRSRAGMDKRRGHNGDLAIVDGPNGVLQRDQDMSGDRQRAVGNAAVGNRPRAHPFRSFRQEPPSDEPVMGVPMPGNFELIGISHADDAATDDLTGEDPTLQAYGWPPLLTPDAVDIANALGEDVPLEDIMDPVDRARVFAAQSERLDEESDQTLDRTRQSALRERWRRKQFYLDEEEGMTKPPGYAESDSSDDEADHKVPESSLTEPKPSSRRQSMRSRSSSKVRFDDSAIDTDYETRSNASSRSMPVGERWGGYELSRPEEDIGKEILYQAVQQGFNELLDPLFKQKEDEAMEAMISRPYRARWAQEIEDFENGVEKAQSDRDEALRQADMLRTEEMLAGGSSVQTDMVFQDTMDQQPDPEDHIGLMFGTNALSPNAEEVDEDVTRDPTLPQNRPSTTTPSPPYAEQQSLPPFKPSQAMLEKWLRHKRIEEEAQQRHGSGKLSYMEFAQKMVVEDEVGRALGTTKNIAEDDEEVWGSSAELGRLAFVGSWLEMASF